MNGYLTFKGSAAFTLATANTAVNWDGILEYSTDTTIWTVWSGESISSVENLIYLRGTGNSIISGSENGTFTFTTTGTIACEGYIEVLLDFELAVAGVHPAMSENCYHSLFKGCTALVQMPKLKGDALTVGCYVSMFQGCSSLMVYTEANKTDDTQFPMQFPISAVTQVQDMFTGTAGGVTTPTLNTTYYTVGIKTVYDGNNYVLNISKDGVWTGVPAIGIPGESATLRLGRVTTGLPGTNVIITNSGNNKDAVYNFTIPRGALVDLQASGDMVQWKSDAPDSVWTDLFPIDSIKSVVNGLSPETPITDLNTGFLLNRNNILDTINEPEDSGLLLWDSTNGEFDIFEEPNTSGYFAYDGNDWTINEYPAGTGLVVETSEGVFDTLSLPNSSGLLTYDTNDGLSTLNAAGSAINPVYLDSGAIVASDATIGSEIKFMYMDSGELVESATTIGDPTVPVYLFEGEITESNASVGSLNIPIYIDNGVLSECEDLLYVDITGTAAEAEQLVNGLIVNDKYFDGSDEVELVPEDFGVDLKQDLLTEGPYISIYNDSNLLADAQWFIPSGTNNIYYFLKSSDGALTAESSTVYESYRTLYFPCASNTTYTFTFNNSTYTKRIGSFSNVTLAVGNTPNVYIADFTDKTKSITTGNSDKWIAVQLYINGDYSNGARAATIKNNSTCVRQGSSGILKIKVTDVATVPTDYSDELITSGGVKTYVDHEIDTHTHSYAGSAISGGAATKAISDENGNNIRETYAAALDVSGTSVTLRSQSGNDLGSITITSNTSGATNLSNTRLYLIGATEQSEIIQTYSNEDIYISEDNVLMGAAWNDYAEFRQSDLEIEAGRVIVENGDDTVSLCDSRLQPAAMIVSDTFGFAIGQSTICNTPVAVSGRALAYPYEDRNSFKPGDAVCSGPNGTVSKMTREEIKEYPERIIGTVSAIPNYDTWGAVPKPVNGRIWIKVY